MSGPYSAEQRLAHDNHHSYTVGCAICRDLEAEDAIFKELEDGAA